ncbi:CAP domain-containing protein [Pseudomonas sp. RIT-PI-S]|uniref:CAP domain-containing protein n=1 Tax=Pseudomonas sp. RIT-PI-S TaxID=3035295 RepID=UPI0021DB0962|nr:CAP domain-containing protein [Pseudomonas sp. RIT-PI-S]
MANGWRAAALGLGWVLACTAMAGEERQLVDALNNYRGQPQRCGEQASLALPPLAPDTRLQLSVQGSGDLNAALASAGYPMVTARAISLSGPRDAPAALAAVTSAYCQVVLDPQFVDVGVRQEGRDWRIVLARPLLTARLGSAEAEGRKLLEQINQARAQARQCGAQPFAAAAPLSWDMALATAAEGHSRDMANNNYFDHADRTGALPGDRAELAGFTGGTVGENIAAGQDSAAKVVQGWLASPGHCANLMNPSLQTLGAAYATDPKSDAGIYWTALFGAP